MIKKVILCVLTLAFSSCSVFAATTLREPQGRLGTYFKTEKITYPPTNMTKKDLEQIHKTLNKNNSENADLQAKKREEQNLKDMQRQKLAEKKQAALQQAKEEKAQEKVKLAEQKQLDAKKKLEEKELAAAKQQEENIKREEEKKQLALQKAEEKRIAQEEKSKAILSHKNQNEENDNRKISFNFWKKEKNNVEDIQQNTSPEVKNTKNTTEEIDTTIYVQDSDTKNIVKEITTELTDARPQMLEELSTLWVSAVQKSDTVYFAIMKLSNPNGEEVNKNGFKKILEPILSAAPLVGQAFVNPALTAGSIIGSNVMGTMMNDGMKSRLTKVNDADLVILARAIDELQESLLINYMAYKGAKEEYELAIQIAAERQREYEEMNSKNSPNTILANTFYTEALDHQYKARQEFLMKRVVLEQMVGEEALNEIENPKPKEEQEEETQAAPKE